MPSHPPFSFSFSATPQLLDCPIFPHYKRRIVADGEKEGEGVVEETGWGEKGKLVSNFPRPDCMEWPEKWGDIGWGKGRDGIGGEKGYGRRLENNIPLGGKPAVIQGVFYRQINLYTLYIPLLVRPSFQRHFRMTKTLFQRLKIRN